MGIPGGAGRGPRIRRVPSSQLGYASPLPRYTHPDRGVCPDLRSYLLGDILSIALRDGNRGVAHRCRGYGGAFRHVCDLPGSSSRQYVGRSDVGASIASISSGLHAATRSGSHAGFLGSGLAPLRCLHTNPSSPMNKGISPGGSPVHAMTERTSNSYRRSAPPAGTSRDLNGADPPPESKP